MNPLDSPPTIAAIRSCQQLYNEYDEYDLLSPEQIAAIMAAWSPDLTRWPFASDETKAAEEDPPLPPPKRSRRVVLSDL